MNRETQPIKGHTCPWWLLFTFDNPVRKLIHSPEKILSQFVRTGDIVLDIGCGMGYFSLGLAELVGNNGQVIAADLQAEMLSGLKKRAERAGLLQRIELHQTSTQEIGVNKQIDFALAFWMVHEVRQPKAFLQQIYDLLKPEGKFLVVEPILHVSRSTFEQTLALAKTTGFTIATNPKVKASRAVLLVKPTGRAE